MKKIITSFSPRAAMILLATLLLTLTAQTARADNVNYLDDSGSTQTAVNPTAVTNGMQELGSYGETTWYVVNSDVTISRQLSIKGTVHLILADSKELTVNNSNASSTNGYYSIYMDSGSSLTVYSQSIGNDMGKLTASTSDGGFFVTSLTINGGQISVTGTIAGVLINDGGSMIVNNGHVTINSTNTNSDAIYNMDLLHIYGGTVIANGLDISKANPTVTAPTPRTLVYSGSAQELVTAGTTTHGTMIYSTDGSNYSEAIPTGTEVGTYTVYYKVEEGATWNAVAPQTVSVTIKQGTSYVNAAGEQQLNVDAAAVTGSESSIGENNQTKWYVVSGTVSFSQTLGIYGDVNLILADNAEMTITADDNGIYMLENSSLTIYTQSHGDNKGKLTITGEGITIERNCSLTINGGHISVTASNHGVHIGSNSSMTVNNGDLTISSSNATAINDLSKYICNGGTVRLYDNTSSVHQAAYVNAAGEQQASVDVTIVNNRNLGEAGQTTWYFVNGDITFDGLLDISGTVNLIIADGKELTVNTSDTNYGIYIRDNSSLNIYTQSHGDSKGKLTVSSGWPGVYMLGTGNLTINGGLISITSRGYQSVGVYFGSNGSMTIYNGDVTITSQQDNAIAANDKAKVTKTGGKLVLNDFGVINDNVSYLDASGVSQSHNVIVLQNTNANIGASGETWYVVRGNTTFNNKIVITGNVNLILEDGAVMSIEDASDHYSIYMNEGSSLTIYSQSTGDSKGKLTPTGAISIRSTSILIINGGEITATGDDNGYAFYIEGAMTINGGQVTATGGTRTADNTKEAAISFQDGGTLTLGYNSANDFIQINGITNTNETLGTINVKSGQHFVADDDDEIVTGNGVAYTAVANKKLVPCHAVTFDANGGSFGSETTILRPAKFNTSGNAYVSKPDDPTRDDCTFSEWQLSGTAYDFTATVTSDMTLTAKWKELPTNTEPVSYITATGISDTKAAGTVYVLDGTEDELGTSGQTTWYIVPSTATGNNALSYKGRLKLNGDVHLILADGSKMTADGTDDPESGHYNALDAVGNGQLTIYGQANGTGELNAITGSGSRAFNVTGTGCALTICGGVVNAKADFAFNGTSLIIHGGKFTTVAEEGITDNISINATNVQINGGEVTIGGYIQSGTGDVEINGGKVDVSGNIQSTSGDIILGWTNASDHITAVLYQTNTSQDHNVKIADGKVLKYTDGTVKLLHTGIVAPSVISGKELTPYGIFGYCGKTSENGGKNVYWSIALNDDPETDAIYSNTLVIEKNNNASGQTNFDMANYRNDNSGNFAPWIKPNNAGNESDGLKYPITAVTIADGVTSIGGEAFENCRSLQNVTIGSSVTSIGNQAFDHCSGLQIVTIGNSVTSIGYQAFDYCSGLQKVNIGNSVTTIGNCAFRECRGLQEVNIGSSVTTIGDHAFENCRELQNVTIPASVTTINGDAFRTCINLTVVTMRPSTPPSLQNSDVFRDCDLKLIIVPNETAYTAYNGAGEGWDGKISENINTSPEDITYKSLLAPSVISLAKNASGWGTYCHGYPVSYSLSEGATAYTLSGLNNDKTAVTIQETAVTIQETDVNAVAPLTPLLLNYTAPDNDAETDDETVTLTALPATATTDSYGAIVSNGGTGCTFYGNATGTTLMHDPNSDPDDGIPALIGGWPTYILRNGTFVLVDTDEGIPAHRCVLSVGSSNAARVLTIGTGDETTGIEELKNGRIEELKWAGAWYSLDGRKLDKQPTKKGLYIYNGKKTVIK